MHHEFSNCVEKIENRRYSKKNGLSILIKSIFFIFMTIIVMSSRSYIADASSNLDDIYDINIKIPSFDVRLNDTLIDNKYSKYPLITYKDITYIPMTYNISRYLGLESQWSSQSGLEINNTNVFGEYKKEIANTKNKDYYKAKIKSTKTSINGKDIVNSFEKYPLINFRGITYIPLTWRFAVDEFNWNYNFDEYGLKISTKYNIPKQLNLSERILNTEVLFHENVIYYISNYEGAEAVCRRNLETNTDELIFELPSRDDNPYHSVHLQELYVDDNEVCFEFNVGGATMGHSELFKVNDDASVESIGVSRSDVIKYKDGKYICRFYGPFSDTNNLSIIEDGEHISIGSESNYYNLLKLKGDTLYAKRSNSSSSSDSVSALFTIDLEDYSEKLINSINIDTFELYNDGYYILEKDTRRLYKQEFDSEESELVSKEAVLSYAALERNVFYIKENSNSLYMSELSGKEKEVFIEFKASKIKTYNNYLVCTSSIDSNYGMLVLNLNGEILFKSNQLLTDMDMISIDNDNLFYVTKENKCFLINLKS